MTGSSDVKVRVYVPLPLLSLSYASLFLSLFFPAIILDGGFVGLLVAWDWGLSGACFVIRLSGLGFEFRGACHLCVAVSSGLSLETLQALPTTQHRPRRARHASIPATINFNRFVSKKGLVVWFKDRVEERMADDRHFDGCFRVRCFVFYLSALFMCEQTPITVQATSHARSSLSYT